MLIFFVELGKTDQEYAFFWVLLICILTTKIKSIKMAMKAPSKTLNCSTFVYISKQLNLKNQRIKKHQDSKCNL